VGVAGLKAGSDAGLAASLRDTAARRPPDTLLELIPRRYQHAWTVGDSAAELEAWRTARRSRFPTTANVAARRSEAAKRAERGELLPPGAAAAAAHGAVTAAAAATAAAAQRNADVGVAAAASAGAGADVSAAALPASPVRGGDQGQGGGDSGSDDDDDDGGDEPEEAPIGVGAGGMPAAKRRRLGAAEDRAADATADGDGPAVASGASAAAADAALLHALPPELQAELLEGSLPPQQQQQGPGAGPLRPQGGERPQRYSGPPVCHAWQRGRCIHGARCRFSHDPAAAAAAVRGQWGRGDGSSASCSAAPFGPYSRHDPADLPRDDDAGAGAVDHAALGLPPPPGAAGAAAFSSSSAGASAGPGGGYGRYGPSGAATGAPACRYFLLGLCHRGAGCPYSHGAAATEWVAPSRRHLLRKLLAGEETREASAVLQCLRFLVRNNFLAAPTTAAAAGAGTAGAGGADAAAEAEAEGAGSGDAGSAVGEAGDGAAEAQQQSEAADVAAVVQGEAAALPVLDTPSDAGSECADTATTSAAPGLMLVAETTAAPIAAATIP
jgi:hypothetical protein